MVDLHVRSYMHDSERVFVAMLHDITAAKNLQEAARLTTNRLEQVNRELQHVSQLRSEFYTTIARRLRSPLSAILGLADMMLAEELGEITPEQRRALQSCRRSVMRVFGLADEVVLAAPERVAAVAGATDAPKAAGGTNPTQN
jgi:signal transduction histidine kinase